MVDLIFTDRPTSESTADLVKAPFSWDLGRTPNHYGQKSRAIILNLIPIPALCAMTLNIFFKKILLPLSWQATGQIANCIRVFIIGLYSMILRYVKQINVFNMFLINFRYAF